MRSRSGRPRRQPRASQIAASVPKMPNAAGAAMAKRASSSEQRIGRTTMTTASSTVRPIMMARKMLLPGMISSTAADAAMKLAPATMTTVLARASRSPMAVARPTRTVVKINPTASVELELGELTASRPSSPVSTTMPDSASTRPTAERRRMSRTMPPIAYSPTHLAARASPRQTPMVAWPRAGAPASPGPQTDQREDEVGGDDEDAGVDVVHGDAGLANIMPSTRTSNATAIPLRAGGTGRGPGGRGAPLSTRPR